MRLSKSTTAAHNRLLLISAESNFFYRSFRKWPWQGLKKVVSEDRNLRVLAPTTRAAVNRLTSHFSYWPPLVTFVLPGFHLSFSANWWPSAWHDEDFRSRYGCEYIFITGFGHTRMGWIVGCLGWMRDDFLTKYDYGSESKVMEILSGRFKFSRKGTRFEGAQNKSETVGLRKRLCWYSINLVTIQMHLKAQVFSVTWSILSANCSNVWWSYWNK